MKITIKNDEHLKGLACSLGVKSSDLAKLIIKRAIKIGVIHDEKEYCGSKLVSEFKNFDLNLVQMAKRCIVDLAFDISLLNGENVVLNKRDPYLLADLRELTIWGIHNDCPECGYEMDFTDEGKVGRYIWHERTCLNCGKVISNEPDWDTVSGGHDNRNNF
jgi:hypothetical protein